MITLLLAWRYLKGTHERSIATMVRVCFIGILIAVYALTVTISVMRGFEVAMFEKLQGINANIAILNYGQEIDIESLDHTLSTSYPEIAAYCPEEIRQVIIEMPTAGDSDQIMVLRGVDRSRIGNVIKLEEKIIHTPGTVALPDLLRKGHVLIGKKKAQYLGLHVGDELTILYAPTPRHQRKISFKATHAIISGLFATGIEDYDTGVLFCDFSFLQQLFPHSGYTEVGLRLKPGSDEQTVITRLREEFPAYEIVSWKDRYASLVAASKLERYVMFFILTLMTLVASMNIISLMFMQITQKRADIAILRSMGASHVLINHIFLMTGILITLSATIVGLLAGALTCWLLQRYPFIELPDVYYTSHLPATLELQTFITVFIVAMVVSIFSIWYAVQQTKKINVAQVLRNEG